MHLDKTQHNLKYKYGSNFTPTEITYHQTSNNARALNERNYLNNRTDKVYIGFHIVVDDQVAIECLPLTVQTWHAGDGATGAGNMKSIGIEIAYSTSSNINLRNAAIENGAKVIASLMKTYNIPMSKVLPHQARSGKHCPHDILDRYGHEKFRALIQKEYNEIINLTPTPTPTPIPDPGYKVGDSVIASKGIRGYKTANSTTATTTVSAGNYKVYKVAANTLHPINISKSGQTPGAWVNETDITKIKQDLVAGNQVQLTKSISGYVSSDSETPSSTLKSGKYIIFKVNKGSNHPINISKSPTAPGAWVDEDGLSWIGASSLQAGDQVKVMKKVNGYITSNATTSTTLVEAGTYYVYKYVSGATYAVNVSKSAQSPGAWIDISDLTLV
jgi:N-acetylmuramoyl-L-alanine amidase CwlA